MEYENAIQDGRHTNSNSQVNQDVFVMKGLGNHYTAVIGGLQSLGAFQYTSNKLGGELQYGLRFSGLNLLLNGGTPSGGRRDTRDQQAQERGYIPR